MTGADEHGQKIAETAARQGMTPKELCDQYVTKFQARRAARALRYAPRPDQVVRSGAQELNARLSISNDVYNRTTSAKHHACCQLIFRKSLAAGDIYLGSYEGWCVTVRGAPRHAHAAPHSRDAGTTCARRRS